MEQPALPREVMGACDSYLLSGCVCVEGMHNFECVCRIKAWGESSRRVLRKLCLLTFYRSPVVWFICFIADIHHENIVH